MKKSLLFLFLLVLGVTQGWAQVYETLPASGNNPDDRTVENQTLKAGGIYRVEANTTIDGTQTRVYGLRVPKNSTVTIYIAKGKTLTVNGQNGSAQNTPGMPAIEVPSNSTLIVTGGGILRVTGGKAFNYATTNGGSGAAPAIGGKGGVGSAKENAGGPGDAMGTVYIRGNVTVRAARGTSRGLRVSARYGADGAVPTYAIGGGGGGGAGAGSKIKNGNTGGAGTLFVERTARVVYRNGSIRRPVTKFKDPNVINVKFDANGGSGSASQKITEYGNIKVDNNKFSHAPLVSGTDVATGFTKVKIYTLTGWADEGGNVYTSSDLILAQGTGTKQSSDLTLYAQWAEGEESYAIYTPDDLMKFAAVVNGTYEYKDDKGDKQIAFVPNAKGIMMNDIDMDGYEWMPIGGISDQELSADGTRPFKGVFDGNGYIVSNLKMSEPKNWTAGCGRAGLIGYALGATIKNVVVENATLWGKWNVAAICGRFALDNEKGSISNCGSFGTLNLNHVSLAEFSDITDLALSARAAAGVAVMLGKANDTKVSNPTCINSVWSTYEKYDNTGYNNTNRVIKYNYVIATNNSNDKYGGYTQNSGVNGTKKTWVYVAVPSEKVKTDNSAWLTQGKLCHDLNGKVDGATTWTQTFGDNAYSECPRPTGRGMAVYYKNQTNEYYYNRYYTVSFESNGGSDCDDLYIVKKGNDAKNEFPLVCSAALPSSTHEDNYEFQGWYKEDGTTNVTDDNIISSVSSDITLYARWLAGPKTADVIAYKVGGYCYGTVFYSNQAYEIPESLGITAYKAYMPDETSSSLTMKRMSGNVIPAGEAVILKVANNNVTINNESCTIQLTAVNSDKEKDEKNVLEGSDVAVTPTEEEADKTYIFTYGTLGLGFYLQPDNTALTAHKAYIILDQQLSVDLPAKGFQMIFEDDEEQTTGISEFKSDTETKKAIFSINGMPLSKLQKGINIVGGKKVFVK